jgi:hypothetical protein
MMSGRDSDYTKDLKVLSAIKMVKNSGAKLIWLRWLWPAYHIEQSRPEDLFDPNFYIQEIRFIRAEADKIDADFVAFDTEAYGNSPLKRYLSATRMHLSSIELNKIQYAISEAISKTGQIDYILPAASLDKSHPYCILAQLGKNRISEHTYYNNEKNIRNIKYPYEIFGAYVNTTRENKSYPELPYFLISDIFDNSYLWSNKKGIWLYPSERNADAVARELVKYARNLPAAKAGREPAKRN